MTKLEAIRIMLEIVTECDKQDSEGGTCKTCPFGHENICLVSGGNDIPHNWQIKDKLQDKSDIEALDMAIQALKQTSVLDQIKWERDVALDQLKQLGYGFGEKPRTDGDLISRQAVLDIFGDIHPLDYNTRAYVTQIKEFPSAEKTAEWNYEKFGFRTCSNCGYSNVGIDNDGVFIPNNYCPNCGAKMKGVEE